MEPLNPKEQSKLDRLSYLPRFEILSKLDNIPNLNNFDIEGNIVQENDFDYYTTPQFRRKLQEHQCSQADFFSAFHVNIRSLAANYYDMCDLLADLAYTFTIICLSETKIKHNVDQISNTEVLGYDFLSQPTLSNSGEVGLYVRQGLQYHFRDDLSSSTEEYESLWIEIRCKSSKNIVCGVTYRHPNSKTESSPITYFQLLTKSQMKTNFVYLWATLTSIYSTMILVL